MSIKQDRTGTRTSEDLRRRLNVSGIEETKEKADASLETVEKMAKQVDGLNNTVKNTRETYVSTNVQTFTEEQKIRARENIGAGNSSFSGSYKDLTDKPTKLSDFTNDEGYITGYNETDPTVPTHVKNITEADINKWNSGTGGGGSFDEILNLVCPIGKVEVFFDNNDHSNYLGFTWERTSIGRVPVGIDANDTDFNPIGKTGGSKKLQAHDHNLYPTTGSGFYVYGGTTNRSVGGTGAWYGTDLGALKTKGAGEGDSQNLQPYEVMAFWKRVS